MYICVYFIHIFFPVSAVLFTSWTWTWMEIKGTLKLNYERSPSCWLECDVMDAADVIQQESTEHRPHLISVTTAIVCWDVDTALPLTPV